jgi:hypothetical protein
VCQKIAFRQGLSVRSPPWRGDLPLRLHITGPFFLRPSVFSSCDPGVIPLLICLIYFRSLFRSHPIPKCWISPRIFRFGNIRFPCAYDRVGSMQRIRQCKMAGKTDRPFPPVQCWEFFFLTCPQENLGSFPTSPMLSCSHYTKSKLLSPGGQA